jgi:predicted AlkP superfamily phosphohydrolase/phosphomutase
MNIPFEKLRCGTIIEICNDLGCDIEYPSIPKNKYFEALLPKNLQGLDNWIIEKLKLKFDMEQSRIVQEYDEIFDEYMDSLDQWLVDNGYAEDR